MISLSKISIHVPETCEALETCAESLGLNKFETQMFRRFHGLSNFVTSSDVALSDYIAPVHQDPGSPCHVFHCHTIPTITPDGSGAIPARFDTVGSGLTMAHCAGPLVLLDLLSETLRPDETARIIVGEKSFHPKIKLIPNVTIMSDIAISFDVQQGKGICQRIDGETRVCGAVALNSGLDAVGGVPEQFETEYSRLLAEVVFTVLDRQRMDWGDLRWIFPHNVNVSSWRGFAKTHNLNTDKIYLKNISRFGHAFGADPFLNFETARQAGEITAGDRALLVSVGLGMTANATLVECTEPFSKMKKEALHEYA